MTEKEYAELGDACDLICSLCEKKYEHAFSCEECPVTDVYEHATVDEEYDEDEGFFGMDEDLPDAGDMLGSDL